MAHPPSQVQQVFGDPVVDRELAEWLDANGRELQGPQPLRTGGSGGQLVSAYVHVAEGHEGTGGMRIIKLVGPSPDAEAEPKNHRAALALRVRGTEEFTRRHLVGLDLHTWKLNGSWVMFQFPAGDGQETQTLAELGRSPRLPGLLASIVGGVLAGWNPRPSTRGRDASSGSGSGSGGETPLSAAQFVGRLLGARADQDSELRSWARDRIGPDVDREPYLVLPGETRPLPNPLALGEGSPLSGHHLRFAPRGHAHGDLHPGNIMVPVDDDAPADDFWLIDLSRFREDALLARDPVHLLVCVITDSYLPHLSGEARAELLAALCADAAACPGPLIPQGLAEAVTGVRRAWLDWGASPHLGISESWRPQWFLALQACALMVSARSRYDPADRWWFFHLAARACGAYLDTVKARRPDTAPVVSAPQDVPAVAVVAVPPGAVADPGRGDASPSASGPTASTRPAATAAPEAPEAPEVRRVLQDIWDAFEPLRLALPRGDGAGLGLLATHVREHASRSVLALAGLPTQESGPLEAELDQIVARVRDVESRAAELTRGLSGKVGLWDDRGSRRPGSYDALAAALDDLLIAVGRVRSAPGATGT